MRDLSGTPIVRAKLWDAPTRIVHWSLVALIAFAWWTAENDRLDWHRLAGYAVLALLVFRLIWGFVGSRSARFSSFVKGPAATFAYLRALSSRGKEQTVGHNPLGAWSVIAILMTLIVQVVTGLFAVDVDGIESGPLSDRVDFNTGRLFARVHHLSFTLLEILIVLHLAAILFHAMYKRHDLVRPMITGWSKFGKDPGLTFAPTWRAIAVGIGASLIAWWAANGFRF